MDSPKRFLYDATLSVCARIIRPKDLLIDHPKQDSLFC